MMSASRATAQQLHQIEALADDSLVGIETMIGNYDERSFTGHGTVLDARPETAQLGIDLLQGGQMLFAIVVVRRRVIKSHRQKIEVPYAGIAEVSEQFALQLLAHDIAGVEAGDKFGG